MRYKISRLPQSIIEICVTIPRDDMRREAELTLGKMRKNLELPGFRKGAAPLEIARERIGEFALYEQAIGNAAQRALSSILVKEALEPIERPEVAVTKLLPNDDAEFSARFPILPNVCLPKNWRDIIREAGKERKEPSIQNSEVSDTLALLQESRATDHAVARAAKQGDVVTATIRAHSEGKPIPHGTLEHHSFVLGKGNLMPGVEEHIEGLLPGEEKEFNLQPPDSYWAKELQGKLITFRVKAESVKERKIPALDNAFAAAISKFGTLDELSANIRKGLLEEKQAKEKERMRILMVERLAEKIPIDVPQALLARELDQMNNELRHSTSNTGLDWDAYLRHIKRTEESLREDFQDNALRRVKLALVIRQISTEIQAEPTNEETEAEMNKYLLRYSSTEDARRHIDVTELARYTKNILRNEKAFQYLESLNAQRSGA